jgi:hypothetical protein
VKAKESCGMHKDAIRDLAPDNMRTIVVAEVLNQLRGKTPSHPSNCRFAHCRREAMQSDTAQIFSMGAA